MCINSLFWNRYFKRVLREYIYVKRIAARYHSWKERRRIDWFIWSERDLSWRLTKEGVNRVLEVGRERIGLDLIGIRWELFGVNWEELGSRGFVEGRFPVLWWRKPSWTIFWIFQCALLEKFIHINYTIWWKIVEFRSFFFKYVSKKIIKHQNRTTLFQYFVKYDISIEYFF